MEEERKEEIDEDFTAEFTENDLEKVKERIENMEFNNEEEDEAEMVEDDEPVSSKKEVVEEEEDEEDEEEEEVVEEKPEVKDETSSKNDNKIIYILCGVVVLLLIVILFLVLPDKKESKGESSNQGSGEAISKDEKPSVKKVDISLGESYFLNDNYLYVISNNKGYVTNLDGKTLFEDADLSCAVTGTKQGYFICEEKKSDSKVKYTVKKVDESGTIINVYKDDKYGDPGRKLYDEWGRVIGIYTESKNIVTVHLVDGTNTDIIGFSVSDYKIYNERFIIISKEKKYGVYDIKENKTLISPKYNEITFLHDDLFRVVDSGKEGIVNKDDSTKLGLRFEKVAYSNGLNFAVSGNTLSIMDGNYKEIGKVYGCTSFDLTAFMDKVIIHKYKSSEGYIVVDKTGKTTNYDFKNFELFYNYVVTLKDNTLTLYDASFNKVQDFPLGNISIDLPTVAIFLEDYLIFNGNRLFNIENGQYLHDANNLARSYQGYYISLNINGSKADAVVSLDDVQIGTISGIDPVEFLRADNNGIRVTNQYFIFSVGNKNLIIKR